MINAIAKRDILAHAADCYPLECCGVIVSNKYYACRNIVNNMSQFEIDPRDIVAAGKHGKIQAYVHSHPDGTTDLSIPDRIGLSNHKIPWVITDGVSFAVHKPVSYVCPLLGREYFHGLLDCYTLVRDYYSRELGVELRDYKRSDAWWEDPNADPLYLNNFAKEGFVEVDDVREHDVILTRLGRTEHVNHAVVFIGEGSLKSEITTPTIGNSMILHHPYNRQSLREVYGEQWQRRTAKILRHKSKM